MRRVGTGGGKTWPTEGAVCCVGAELGARAGRGGGEALDGAITMVVVVVR